MKETDQELKNLLHYLNLPGALRVPVRVRALQCQDNGRVRRRYVAFAGPAHEERCATRDPVPPAAKFSRNPLLHADRVKYRGLVRDLATLGWSVDSRDVG